MNLNRLGPYEILGVLGRGGMGTVYRAKHFETGELVALKALSHNYTEDEHFRQRFESEINALLKLDHPNIVRLISYGQDEGVLYFAMELVEGKSLFHLQREFRTFDWRDVLVIATTASNATGSTLYNGPIVYAVDVQLLAFDQATCGTATNDCITASASGGCKDAACCDAVCALNAACCSVAC